MLAAQHGKLDVVKQLIGARANVNAQGKVFFDWILSQMFIIMIMYSRWLWPNFSHAGGLARGFRHCQKACWVSSWCKCQRYENPLAFYSLNFYSLYILDEYGQTPLILAVRSGRCLGVIRFLEDNSTSAVHEEDSSIASMFTPPWAKACI